MMQQRFDYILIWGHGLQYVDRIREMVRNHSGFTIKKIIYHKSKSIKKLINAVYSYDYAPIEHLREKIKYLLATPDEVAFVFIENKNPTIDFLGEGFYRHEESLTLKSLKETIRDKYNPKINGKRTEDHVVHASDNELQTDYILKYLSYKEGIKIFCKKNAFLSAPYYIGRIKKLRIRKISTNLLMCNIISGESRYKYSIETKRLIESPHYRGLTENVAIYQKYIDKFLGGPLTEDYYAEKFIDLSNDLQYLENNHMNSYIIVKEFKSAYLILDGLHRASILASRGIDNIVVGEVIE